MPRGSVRVSPGAECQRRWREQNKEWISERNKRWSANNPDIVHRNVRRSILKKYGLTNEEYDELLEAQQGRCGICGTDKTGHSKNKYFCVDHDHKTSKVRGLLCYKCNIALGHFQDNPSILLRAVEYLDNSPVAQIGQGTMPRGQYDRTKMKKKGEAKTQAPATKTPVAAKAAVAKAPKEKKVPTMPEANPAEGQGMVYNFDENYMHIGQKFQILSMSLTSLVEARKALGPKTSDPYTIGKDSPLHDAVEHELCATLSTLSHLREKAFGKAKKIAEPKSAEAKPEVPAQAPVVTAGVPIYTPPTPAA